MAIDESALPRFTYLLLLLDADDSSPVAGKTRLEKLAFLIQKRAIEGLKVGITQDSYRFRPLHYGPFTEEVFDDILALQMLGLVDIGGDDESEQWYSITRKGSEAVRRLIDQGRVSPILVEEIRRIKTHFGKLPLGLLVERVYKDYPGYTEKSQIRDRFL